MTEYNEVFKESSEVCISESLNGSYCQEWSITSRTYYPLATLVLFFQVVVFLLVVRFIRNL